MMAKEKLAEHLGDGLCAFSRAPQRPATPASANGVPEAPRGRRSHLRGLRRRRAERTTAHSWRSERPIVTGARLCLR